MATCWVRAEAATLAAFFVVFLVFGFTDFVGDFVVPGLCVRTLPAIERAAGPDLASRRTEPARLAIFGEVVLAVLDCDRALPAIDLDVADADDFVSVLDAVRATREEVFSCLAMRVSEAGSTSSPGTRATTQAHRCERFILGAYSLDNVGYAFGANANDKRERKLWLMLGWHRAPFLASLIVDVEARCRQRAAACEPALAVHARVPS